MNMKPPRFEEFLAKKVANGQLAPELLPELVGKESANRILDNSMNAQGAPAIGGGHIAVQHGAISEILGKIPDQKDRLSMEKELVDTLNLESFNTQQDNLESTLQNQDPVSENLENEDNVDDHQSKPR
ncbi:hypothetical protein Lrub_2425 [Legionella rubrilucens]|uniref:Uncharacterized protein n=2 Tax=Legionella rubrilucens TaxID=458 RepID=A0A0W0XM18_9GAMM|nr:hypothetical protein Lrub_2425 [Legionella rubrilucens]